jgi:hypothetical protein
MTPIIGPRIGTWFNRKAMTPHSDGIAQTACSGDDPGRDADTGVHQSDRRQIGRYIAFDLLGNIDCLSLVPEMRQHFDQSAQECIAGDQQKDASMAI